MMFNRLNLTTRLLCVGLFLTCLPAVIILSTMWNRTHQIADSVHDVMVDNGEEEVGKHLQSAMDMIAVSHELLVKDTEKVMGFAEFALEKAGGVQEDTDRSYIRWDAVNQYTKEVTPVELPPLVLGGSTPLEIARTFSNQVPVIDDIGKHTGDTATIFQRMNARGDMLRVATNVRKGEQRAVGTYIPATNPDGTPNAVVSEILQGKTFRGRAFVIDQWYVTIYKPLFDDQRNVTGILYVGSPEKVATDPILSLLDEVQIGKTGYLYILNTKGDDVGRYVLSHGRDRDGESIIDARDSDGRAFIREMVESAKEMTEGSVGTIHYPWKNEGELTARDKIAEFSYFAPLDWVVAAGTYEDEFYEEVDRMSQQFDALIEVLAVVALVITIVAGFILFLVTRGITKPVSRMIRQISKGSEETGEAANSVAEASQAVATGASEQAENLDRTTHSMETILGLVGENAKLSAETRTELERSGEQSRQGLDALESLNYQMGRSSEAVVSMTRAIDDVQDSSNAISKIIGTIDEIAFQTNILALNASVEAARAGEAGAEFAVVAEEVRNLAHRAADAAEETSKLIARSVSTSKEGAEATSEVSGSLKLVNEQASKVAEIIKILAKSIQDSNTRMSSLDKISKEQESNIKKVGEIVAQVSDVTQRNAAGAEEAASAAEELLAQATTMDEIVDEMNGVIRGSSSRNRLALSMT